MVCAVAWAGLACRDDEQPPERFNRSLGTAARPLMPPPAPAVNADLSGGRRADVVPLVDLEPVANDAGTGAGDNSADDREADRRQIAELIESARAANAAADFVAFAELVVERHRELMLETVTQTQERHQAVVDVVALLESADPSPFAGQVIVALRLELGFPADPGEVTFQSETEASVPMGPMTVPFEKEGHRWLLVSPVPTVELRRQVLSGFTQMLDRAKGVLEDDSLSTDDRDNQLAVILQSMLTPNGDADADADADAATNPNADADADP